MKNCPNCKMMIPNSDQLCINCGYLFYKNEHIDQEKHEVDTFNSSTFSVTAAGIDYDIYFLTQEKFSIIKSKNISLYNIDFNKDFEYLFSGQLLFDADGFVESGKFDCTTVIEMSDENYDEEISIDFKLINERIETKINERIFESLGKHSDSDFIFIRYSLEKGLRFSHEFDHLYNEKNIEFFEKNIKLITYGGFCESFQFKNEEIFFDNVDYYRSKGEYYKLFKINDLNEVEFFDFEE